MKILENVIVSSVIKWSKKKTCGIVLMLLSFIVMLSPNFKTDPLSVIGIIYILFHISVIMYIKIFTIKSARQEFDKYRNSWNTMFKDNSFDSYFKLEDIFDPFFEFNFNAEATHRKFREEFFNRDYYDRNTKTYRYSDDINNALKYFGYSSLKEIKSDLLKKKYKELLKKVHPDNGGTKEETETLIRNYNLLKEKI